MSEVEVESVQLYNSTDEFTGKISFLPSQATHNSLQAHHSHWPTHFERIAHRAVHQMWKTRMQLRKYSRPWSQILSLGQLSRPQTRTGVCSAGISGSGQGISRQLSESQTDIRRDFLHQSRTAKTEKTVVKNENGHSAGLRHIDRDHGFRNHRGQYASSSGRGSAEGYRHMGGKR